MKAARILIVGARAAAAELEACVHALGHVMCGVASSGAQALEQAADAPPDLALVDLGLDPEDGAGGIEAAALVVRCCGAPVVYLVGEPDEHLLPRAWASAPAGCVSKPVDKRQLRLSIDGVLAARGRARTAGTQDGNATAGQPNHAAAPSPLAETHGRQRQALEMVFQSISDAVVVANEQGEFTMFNPAAERIVGIGMTDTGPDEWSDQYGLFKLDGVTPYPSEDVPLALAIRGVSSDNVEMFARNVGIPDGVFLSVSGRPLQGEDGKPSGGVVVFRDVSDARAQRDELKALADTLFEQRQTMKSVFDSMSDGVMAIDENGEVTIFNPSARKILGAAGPDVEGDWRQGLFYPDRVTPIPQEDYPLALALRGDAVDDLEAFVRHPLNEEGTHISISARPLPGEHGAVKGGVAVFRDITERVRAAEALARAFDEGRLEILDTLLHNVGNAINSVAIGVSTIREALRADQPVRRLSAVARALAAHRDDWIGYLRDDPQGRKALPFILALTTDLEQQHEQLMQSTERVRGRVEHIVDIVRTQRSFGSGSIERKEIGLREAIDTAVEVLQESWRRREIRIDIDCARAPARIRVQESQFHQMLVNLVKNAVDAIDEQAAAGGLQAPPCIRIAAYSERETLVLEVTDNGIGIPPERLKAIFTAGYTTKTSGSGLGLHSSANFVIGSGGSIQSQSRGIGTGTTMRVTLRMPESAHHAVAAPDAEPA